MSTGDIWIFGDLRSTRHWDYSLSVMAKALPVAREAGVSLVMVVMGSDDSESGQQAGCLSLSQAVQQAGTSGVDNVYRLEHAGLAQPRPDVYARALSGLVAQRKPWLVFFPLNDFGRETAAFCAQRCNAGMIADCAEPVLQNGSFVGRCPAWGGQILADITLADGVSTAFVTTPPHGVALPPATQPPCPIETIALENLDLPDSLRMIGRSMQPAEGRRLEDADIVVVGGAGLGDMRGFGQVRELAAALGGEVGATRPPVLYHWVEEERLIGQTGKSVRPNLLISVGTSGAVQYTAGIAEAKTVVAINRDPKAPIFQWADIGIVADAGALMPLLVKRAQRSAMRRLADAACPIAGEGPAGKGGFGTVVRQLREARNWSVEQLAQATGQTPDFIDQVETEKLSPPVSFIMSMAQAMEVDPGTFLNKEEQTAIRDRRVQAYQRRTKEYSYTTLTPEAQNSHLRAFMVTIEAHHAHKPVAYKHEGEEFIYVMEGDLEFTLGAKVHTLKPGESIHFNSDTPHKLKSQSNTPTRCLVVLYTV